jgi:hypothetical protein
MTVDYLHPVRFRVCSLVIAGRELLSRVTA